MKKLLTSACFFVVPIIVLISFVAPFVSAQEVEQSRRETRTYPDFALQAPPINTSPGPEYASWTRMNQLVPGIERTQNGRLWAVWVAEVSPGGPGSYDVLVTSADDGKSWSEPKLVIDPPGNVSAGEACLWRDPLGRLWLFWTQSYGENDGRHGVWAIVTENSDSENPEWTKPRRLADGMVLNKPTVLTTGEWLLPVGVPNSLPPYPACSLSQTNDEHKLGLSPGVIKALCHDLGKQKGSNVYSSMDQGRTWAWRGQARVPDTGFNEHMIVERRDGSLWMLVRTHYGIGQSVSTDRGETWGQGGPSGIRHPVSRFFIRRLKSGRLLMVRHNPPNPGPLSRSHLTAHLSDDDGKSWYGNLLLDERKEVAYPDGVEADNGKIYVIYDRGRFTDNEILMATFTEEDVRQEKCVTHQCRLKMIVNKAGELATTEM